jgi:hypothetical protein
VEREAIPQNFLNPRLPYGAAVQERASMSLQERYMKGRGTETNSFREVVSLDSKQLEGSTCKCTSWPPRGSILYLTFQSNDSCAMGSAVA